MVSNFSKDSQYSGKKYAGTLQVTSMLLRLQKWKVSDLIVHFYFIGTKMGTSVA